MAKRRKSRSRSRSMLARGSVQRPLTLLVPAAIGAGGALAVNGLVNYVPLPDMLKTGRMIYLTRFGLAVALGVFGRQLPVIGRYATDMARGAMIVTMTDLGKELSLQTGVNLSGTGYVGPSRIVSRQRNGNGRPGNVVRMLPRSGTGMYVPQGNRGMSGIAKYVRR